MSLVVDFNSESSFGGVDGVTVEIENGADAYPARPTFIGGNGSAWPDEIAALVLRAFGNQPNNVPATSGASRFGSLGKTVLPPRMAQVG